MGNNDNILFDIRKQKFTNKKFNHLNDREYMSKFFYLFIIDI